MPPVALPGVDAVLTHRDDVAAELDRLLAQWRGNADDTDAPPYAAPGNQAPLSEGRVVGRSSERVADEGWMKEAGAPAGRLTHGSKAVFADFVKKNPAGMTRLPVLAQHHSDRRRATQASGDETIGEVMR
jgi:hypothetical protein